MILSGDEVRRTRKGNNNGYCQDNELNWFDWNLVEKNGDILRFFQQAIALRKCHCHPSLGRRRFFKGEVNERGLADISWHGCRLYSPGWDNPNSRTLAYTIGGFKGAADIHVMFNMYWNNLEFEIPAIESRKWYRVVDTALPSPEDILESGQEQLIEDKTYLVEGRSIVVLISQ